MRDKSTKIQQNKSSTGFKIGQFIYLTFTSFNQNGLWESASSCSYGFICSFIPIIFLISSILLSVVRISPGIVNYIQEFLTGIFPMLDLNRILENSFLAKKIFSLMDIVLGLWIVWMARKLNISIIRAMVRIFGDKTNRKNWWIQILTFISEFAMVLLVAILILSSFIIRKLLNLPIFEDIISKLPLFVKANSKIIASLVMYFIIFVCTLLAYKFLSGVKPPLKSCFICSLLNTGLFYGLVKIFDTLVNRANYNYLYGTISTIIILIIKVYFFFVLFLFFAQAIYVSQYFDQLLKSKIYFLPKNQDINFAQSFIRMLFINPSILQNEENTTYYSPEDMIFTKGEKVNYVMYLQKGMISLTHDNGPIIYVEAGTLLGETLCILNGNYETSAKALTKCEIIKFSQKEFLEIIEKDPEIAKKEVIKVHNYTKNPKNFDDTNDESGLLDFNNN